MSELHLLSERAESDAAYYAWYAAGLQRRIEALQERIDELETQLFIKQADALPLFEVMHLEPVPEFPSITYTTERTT